MDCSRARTEAKPHAGTRADPPSAPSWKAASQIESLVACTACGHGAVGNARACRRGTVPSRRLVQSEAGHSIELVTSLKESVAKAKRARGSRCEDERVCGAAAAVSDRMAMPRVAWSERSCETLVSHVATGSSICVTSINRPSVYGRPLRRSRSFSRCLMKKILCYISHRAGFRNEKKHARAGEGRH